MDAIWHIEDSGVLQRWRDDLRAHGRLRRWGHRANIDFPGLEGVHLVVDGAIDAVWQGNLLRLPKGSLFGFHLADVELKAYDDTVLLEIHEESLDHLGEKITRVGLINAREYRIPLSKLLKTRDDQRVLAALLHVAQNDAAARIELEVQAKHLARVTGLPLERTKRVFEALQNANLVEVGRRGLVIPDVAAIRAILSGDFP